MKYPLLLSSLVVVLGACSHGHKINLNASENKVTRAGVVTLSAEFLKDKGKKYDIGFRVKNESDQPIIILQKEMRCYRGNADGVLKHTFFNTGERTIDLRGGQVKTFKMACDVAETARGDFRIVVGKVYENKSGDGRSLGKVIGSDIEWRAAVVMEE